MHADGPPVSRFGGTRLAAGARAAGVRVRCGRRARIAAGAALAIVAAAAPAPRAAAAADAAADTVPHGWEQTLAGGLGLAQTEFENYAQGGESSVTWTSSLGFKAVETRARRVWKSEADAQFGQTRLGEGAFRKAADKIEVKSVHSWTLGAIVDPFVSADAKSQFAKAYTYDSEGNRSPAVSRFANPLFFNQAVGVGRTVAKGLTTRLGAAVHEVFVTDDAFAAAFTDDAETAELEKTRVDTGLESVTQYDREFEEKRHIVKSELKLFSTFDDPATVDISWTSKLATKVVSIVSVTLEAEVIYDADIVKRTQLKEVLSVGVSHTFF